MASECKVYVALDEDICDNSLNEKERERQAPEIINIIVAVKCLKLFKLVEVGGLRLASRAVVVDHGHFSIESHVHPKSLLQFESNKCLKCILVSSHFLKFAECRSFGRLLSFGQQCHAFLQSPGRSPLSTVPIFE